jgi:hypothetical protein
MLFTHGPIATTWPLMFGRFGWSGATATITNDRGARTARDLMYMSSDRWDEAGQWRRSGGVMRQAFDRVFLDALARFLALPDPKDLPRRGHVIRCTGDPNRRATRLPAILMAWLQRRCLEIDGEEPLAPAYTTRAAQRRRNPSGMRLLRPTGTRDELRAFGERRRDPSSPPRAGEAAAPS